MVYQSVDPNDGKLRSSVERMSTAQLDNALAAAGLPAGTRAGLDPRHGDGLRGLPHRPACRRW